MMFQLVVTSIYLLREPFCSVGNLMKVLQELSQINQQEERKNIHSCKHTPVHLTRFLSDRKRTSVQIETWWQCAVIDSRRRVLTGGFCQRLITAVGSTHERDGNWETGHLSRCTGTDFCMHFQSKLLAVPFTSYIIHMKAGNYRGHRHKQPIRAGFYCRWWT